MKRFAYIVLINIFVFLWSSGVFAAPLFPDQEGWSGIYYKGKKLGFSSYALKNLTDTVQIKSKVFFKINVGGTEQTTSFIQETILKKDLEPKSFYLLQEVMGTRHQTQGKLQDNHLVLTVSTKGFKKNKTLSYKKNGSLSSSFLLKILSNGLEVGKGGKLPVFMEAFRAYSKAQFQTIGKETLNLRGIDEEAFILKQNIGGMEVKTWVTQEGRVLKEISADGFESILETKEKAQNMGNHSFSASSLITLSVIKPQKVIHSPYTQKYLKIRLSNLLSPTSIPQDHRQKVTKTEELPDKTFASVLTIKVETGKLKAEKPLRKETPDPKALEETAEIQHNHPMIKALAREIVRKGWTPWRAALGINDWVHKNLDKVLEDSVSALDALQKRKGECQSHTNLFVALARAAGIPARVVNGLVYSSEFKGFAYHAWPEVYVDQWRALDPTLGQDVADATHIKLAKGDEAGPLKLLEFMGKLKIQILEN
jgi:hypothetical protein